MIREMTYFDVADVTALWQEWAVERGHKDPDVSAWFTRQWAGLGERKILGVVATDGPAVVGFADALLFYEPATRERGITGQHLYVHPSHRGRGLSEKLMLRLLLLAKQEGAAYMTTHGTPTGHAVEKFMDVKMEPCGEIKIVRW